MKQFIDKLIERLEEEKKYCSYHPHTRDEAINKAISIVNQLAEEYSHRTEDLVIDDSLRTIDVSELLGESGNDGWTPCSERLPDKSMCTDDSGFVTVETTEVLENGERVTFIEDYSLDTKEFLTPYKVIAWRNRPQPYQPKGQAND